MFLPLGPRSIAQASPYVRSCFRHSRHRERFAKTSQGPIISATTWTNFGIPLDVLNDERWMHARTREKPKRTEKKRRSKLIGKRSSQRLFRLPGRDQTASLSEAPYRHLNGNDLLTRFIRAQQIGKGCVRLISPHVFIVTVTSLCPAAHPSNRRTDLSRQLVWAFDIRRNPERSLTERTRHLKRSFQAQIIVTTGDGCPGTASASMDLHCTEIQRDFGHVVSR